MQIQAKQDGEEQSIRCQNILNGKHIAESLEKGAKLIDGNNSMHVSQSARSGTEEGKSETDEFSRSMCKRSARAAHAEGQKQRKQW